MNCRSSCQGVSYTFAGGERESEHTHAAEEVGDELGMDKKLPFGDGEKERAAGEEPEKKEAAHLGRGHTRSRGHVIREMSDGGKDGVEEDVDTLTTSDGVDAVPDTC